MIGGRRDGDASSGSGAGATPIRAFLACPLPRATRRAARALQRRLQEAGLPVRPTRENDLHVTALFLGEVELGRALALWEEVVAVLARMRPSRQRAAGVICLPEDPSPRVVCLALEGDQELASVHRRLADAAIRAGLRVDSRPFLAHATIARVRQPAPADLGRTVRRIAGAFPYDVHEPEAYDRVALWRSELEPGGPRYAELASVALDGPLP